MDIKRFYRIIIAIAVLIIVVIIGVFFFMKVSADNSFIEFWFIGLSIFLMTFPAIFIPNKYHSFLAYLYEKGNGNYQVTIDRKTKRRSLKIAYIICGLGVLMMVIAFICVYAGCKI